MKKLLLGLIMLFLLQTVQSQKNKEVRFIPHVSKTDTSLKNSNASFECRVFQLTNQNKQTSIMIVLVETSEAGKDARTKLRTNYLFKREKTYLKNVFFADVEVLEHFPSVIDVPALLQKLKEQYHQPQLWSVLNTQSFFNTAPQRSGNLFASHR
jgi:hypothetical protein